MYSSEARGSYTSLDQTDGGGGSSPSLQQQKPIRRALGELTNSPRLLSPTTPTKQGRQLAGGPSPAAAITPTHNLKLLTDLAAKAAAIGGGGGSSARQTLQFEDFDQERYASEGIFLHSTLSSNSISSPHRDHPYEKKDSVLTASYVPKDEVCDDYANRQSAEYMSADQSCGRYYDRVSYLPAFSGPQKPSPRADRAAELPPMPDEPALFLPPTERGNRKEKSLGLLAERMLQNYPFMLEPGNPTEVHLDDTARMLNTERRRIYDIVNVLEAVQMMSKVGKNVYNWHGRTYFMQSLAWLKQLGLKLNMTEQISLAREQERESYDIENMSPLQSPRTLAGAGSQSPLMSPYGNGLSPYANNGLSPYGSPNDPNGTSMGINTQKFLMLFLVCPTPKTMTLEFAARVIHGACPNDKTKVTRVRRLYDIANILQALGLISKVQLTEGRGRKPAFQYVGPPVEDLEITEEQKHDMPAIRQKNSLLAVGKNLAQLPDREEGPSNPAYRKRTRSLSGGRGAPEDEEAAGRSAFSRTRSVGRDPDQLTACSSLIHLGQVCEREREKMGERREEEEELGQLAANNPPPQMKPPTPGRPPSRKKVLLQRYYSDSALQLSLSPRPQPQQYNFVSPTTPLFSSRPTFSPRSVPFPSPLALKSSPQTTFSSSLPPQSSPRQPQAQHRNPSLLRSPITPRDLRNAAILPPLSPLNSSRSRIPCSPMGPVGRSLLASPASPRSPIDLTTRVAAAASFRHGRSPLASRSLNLPPSPQTSSADSNSPKQLVPTSSSSAAGPSPLTIIKTSEAASPLLRAYLANNCTSTANNKHRIFQPSPPGVAGESVTVLGLSPPPTPSSAGYGPQPPGSVRSAERSEQSEGLGGIFCTSLPRHTQLPSLLGQAELATLLRDAPLDFSGLIRDGGTRSSMNNTTDHPASQDV